MGFFQFTYPSNKFFYIEGESNSRGFAFIDQSAAGEIGLQKSVKILDVNSFDSLHDLIIGGAEYNNNNLLATVESGQRGDERFGFELEIARRAKINNWYCNPCHMIKVGQGGSIISQWSTNGEYDMLSQIAITNMREFLGGIFYNTIIFYSLGINDRSANTNVATWKAAVKARFAVLRGRLGSDVPIIMTGFQSITGVNMTTYNTAMNEIVQEMENVYCVDSTGCSTFDGIHWGGGENGMKLLTARMLDLAETLF